MAHTPKRGFTLLELIVVIGIIALMAALLFPVFQSVRRNARRSVSASTLHQCWIALQLYCDDYDLTPRQLPTWDVASKALAGAPTCDPQDTWRRSCSENFGSPLIGSYGYSNSDEMLSNADGLTNDWGGELDDIPNPVLLTSIYYADSVPAAFHGEQAPLNTPTYRKLTPNRLLGVYLDGSARTRSFSLPQGPITFNIMDWGYVFALQR